MVTRVFACKKRFFVKCWGVSSEKKEFTKEYEVLDLSLQEVPPASFCIQAQSKIRFRMFSKFPNPNAFRFNVLMRLCLPSV